MGRAAGPDGEDRLDEFALADRPWRVAHSYTLQAVKRANDRLIQRPG